MSQEENVQETVAEVVRPQVRISDCKRMLKEGMDRKQIAAHYGVPVSVMAEKVWSLPELKGLKTKKIYDLEVINDIEEAGEAVQVVENMVPATEEDLVAPDTTVEAAPVVTTESNQAFADMQGNLEEVQTEDSWK
jgi:hypothetical protein